MTLMQLKEFINSGIIPTDFMIFIDKDNKFLARQYIEAMGKQVEGGLYKISSIYEPIQSSVSILAAPANVVNLLKVETFDERAEDYYQFENTIVVCEQVDKSIIKDVEDFIITMPKFEAWQICDYAKTICPTLEENEIQQLVSATDNSIERVVNELDKLILFSKEEQKQILSEILLSPQSDLYNFDLFALVNAFVDGNLVELFNFLRRKDYTSIDPILLSNRILTSLKKILLVQNYNLTAEDLGITPKQLSFLRNKYRNINIEAIKQKIKFLCNIDFNLKTSSLDLSKQDLLNYLVANLAYKIC